MTEEATRAKVRLTDGLGHNAQNAERWYCVSRDGLATLCKDAADAHETSGQCDKSWPLGGPHRAVLLVDAAEIARLRHALAQSGQLAEDRLQQMKADRGQALRWRAHAAGLRDEDAAIQRVRAAGAMLANAAYNLAQKPGHALTSDDVAMLDGLRRKWDESRNGPNV